MSSYTTGSASTAPAHPESPQYSTPGTTTPQVSPHEPTSLPSRRGPPIPPSTIHRISRYAPASVTAHLAYLNAQLTRSRRFYSFSSTRNADLSAALVEMLNMILTLDAEVTEYQREVGVTPAENRRRVVRDMHQYLDQVTPVVRGRAREVMEERREFERLERQSEGIEGEFAVFRERREDLQTDPGAGMARQGNGNGNTTRGVGRGCGCGAIRWQME